MLSSVRETRWRRGSSGRIRPIRASCGARRVLFETLLTLRISAMYHAVSTSAFMATPSTTSAPGSTKEGHARERAVGKIESPRKDSISVWRALIEKEDGMSIRRFEIERFSVTSSRPFEAVVEALKAAIGRLDLVEFAKVPKSPRTFAELEEVINRDMGKT